MDTLARTIIENEFGKQIISIKQFSTGLSHAVFDVVTNGNGRFVIRIARPERNSELEDGLAWQKKFANYDIPQPKIYQTGKINNHTYAIYERLLGSDLEAIYSTLSTQQRKDVAIQIADIQQQVHLLPKEQYVTIYPTIYPWVDILNLVVGRSERELRAKGEETIHYIAKIRKQIQTHQDYFNSVEPVTFLYDLNVRNVIVDQGVVTGIIDVDSVWFGDPLLAIGRGKTILMSMQENLDFITVWCNHLKLSDQQLKMVDFYALLYAIRFIATIGQELNGNYSLLTDPKIKSLLISIADELLMLLNQ